MPVTNMAMPWIAERQGLRRNSG